MLPVCQLLLSHESLDVVVNFALALIGFLVYTEAR